MPPLPPSAVPTSPLRSLPVGLLAFALYAATCARTAQGGDASEFMTIAAAGGVAHPPGYPLYSLLVQAFAAIPVGTVAFRASLCSAALAATALSVLHATVARVTGSSLAGWIAAGALGLSGLFWRYATVSEVFALGALTATLVLWVCARIGDGWSGPRAQAALGLAVATGIANHHTVVLLAPLAFWATWRALPRPLRPGQVAAGLLASAGAQATGFLCYLSLMRPGGAWRWGQTGTLDGLIHHFLRADYGTFDLGLQVQPVQPWEHPLAWLSTLPPRWSWAYAAVAVVGLVVAVRPGPRRGLLLATLASWLVAGPLFLSRFNLGVNPEGLVVASRFYILPDTLLALFAGVGAAALARQRWAGPALLAGLLLHGAAQLEDARHDDWTVLEDHLINALGAVEPDAVLVTSSDHWLFGGRYAQDVLGLRPDVTLVHAPLLGAGWYRDRVAAGAPGAPGAPGAAGLRVEGPRIADAVAAAWPHRPVYLSPLLAADPQVVASLPPLYPESAVLLRVLPPGAPLPSPARVEQQMRQAEARFVLRSEVASLAQWERTWEAWAPRQHMHCWLALESAWRAAGDEEGARRARQAARRWSPFEEPPGGAP